jgi:hypothetical protein
LRRSSARAFERLDALLSETDDDGAPIAFNKVAVFVLHCAQALAATPIPKPPNA